MILVGGILYLNNQGLNKDIRAMISEQMANRGVHLEFDSLSYKLTSGLVAENVTVYADETKQSEIANLPSININLDKTKLLRGIHKLNSVTLIDCHLEVPLDPKQPNGTRLKLNNISGTIDFPDASTIITDSLTASYQGIEINFTGNLWQGDAKPGEPDEDADRKRALAYENFLEKLALWRWPVDSPPIINIFAEGDINAPEHIKLEFKGKASNITRKNFTMEDISIKGELSHNLLSVDKLNFWNMNHGALRSASLNGDFDLGSLAGRFKIESDIHLKDFAQELFDREVLKGTKFKKSVFTADGRFKLEKSMSDIPYTSALPSFLTPFKGNQISLRGNAELGDFSHLGTDFDKISSDFSYDAGNLYLDDLLAENADGYLKARLLIKDEKILFDSESSLPLRSFKPFIKNNQKFNNILSKINIEMGSTSFFKSSGEINANDLTDWDADGTIQFSKVTYDKKYIINNLVTDFAWKNKFLTTNIKVDGLDLGGTKLNGLETTFKWNKGIFSLQKINIPSQKILINEINSNIKEKDGELTGNITLKGVNINGFTFQQLDTTIHNNQQGLGAKINVTKPVFKGQKLEHLKASIFYKDRLDIDQIEIKHTSGLLTGSVVCAKDGFIYYDLISTLNPHLYVPLLKQQNTKELILTAGFNSKSSYKLEAKGRVNRANTQDWSSLGKIDISTFHYNKVPLKRLTSNFDINPNRLVADDSHMIFDYSNYSLKNSTRSKQSEGYLKVDRIIVDNDARTVVIDNAYGKAYPAPVSRMFHGECADHLEDYKFFDPPEIRATGIFDTILRPIKERKIDFKCNLSCPSSKVMYTILDGNLILNDLKANVHVKKDSVTVNNMTANTFKGVMKGDIEVSLTDNENESYVGKFSFLKLNFRDIGITYNFDEIPQGELTGNIHFTGRGDNIRDFNASGNISLDKGNIFSAPVLGPISLILNPLLPKKTHLSERLKNMSANFTIEKGVLRTDNIQSLTTSMTFTGAGWVDLKTDKMDLTIQINYRGLIGKTMELGAEIIRLPINVLRVLFLNKKAEVSGLLQVRGTGQYKDPRWLPMQFDIERGFKGKLFNPPKAVIVP